MQDPIQQLKHMSSQSELGAVSGSKKAMARNTLMEAIGHREVEEQPFSWKQYYVWNVKQVISTPVTAGAMAFVLFFGGWMTSVNAAQSLPGDTLYSVKLVSEKAQLRLASVEHKAVLHTEFAERRLQEAEQLKKDPAREDDARKAMQAFRSEVSLAGDELRKLQQEGSSEAANVAVRVDQRINELNNALEQTPTKAADTEIEQAKDVAREVSNSAVDVIVETHEAETTEGSTRDVQAAFKQDLTALADKQALNLGRLSVIEQAVERDALSLEEATRIESSVLGVSELIAEARRLAAAGGYRAAFEKLREAEAQLRASEAQIVEIEIAITTSLFEEAKTTEATDSVDSTEPEGQEEAQ